MNVDSPSEGYSKTDKGIGAVARIPKSNEAAGLNGQRGSNGTNGVGHTGEKMSESATTEAGSDILVARPSAISERIKTTLDVSVDTNIEKAMRVLKRKLIREGVFKELKTRRYFEKPCDKKKRKHKESVKRVRKEESRQKKFANGIY